MAINFNGAAKRLDDLDLPRLGATIGVGEDEIHAFMEVEAAGSGFDSQGRPKMLFEPHVFHRNLNGEKRQRAIKAGLAYPSWKQSYPKDSYPRLLAAIEIDETAALKSASWGLGQILGENYRSAGYKSPQDMVRAFVEDEEAQLEGMISFLKTNGLDKHLRAHDWVALARGYNGPAYAKNGYHTKLKAAFAKWQKIGDTLYPPPTGGVTYPSNGPDYQYLSAPVTSASGYVSAPAPEPARNDGTYTAPPSEAGFWHRVKLALGL